MCAWCEFADVFVRFSLPHRKGEVASEKTKVDYQSLLSSRREFLPLTLAELQHSKWPRWNGQLNTQMRTIEVYLCFLPFSCRTLTDPA